MENKVNQNKTSDTPEVEQGKIVDIKDETAAVQIKYISREDEAIMLHDISKAAMSGMQNIDIVRQYIENMDLKNYLDRLIKDFARINERCLKYMSEHAVAADFFGSIKQAFQRNATKISMMTTSSDPKISYYILRNVNWAIDTISKNLNTASVNLSPEVVALAKDFRQILENSLPELRKYL